MSRVITNLDGCSCSFGHCLVLQRRYLYVCIMILHIRCHLQWMRHQCNELTFKCKDCTSGTFHELDTTGQVCIRLSACLHSTNVHAIDLLWVPAGQAVPANKCSPGSVMDTRDQNTNQSTAEHKAEHSNADVIKVMLVICPTQLAPAFCIYTHPTTHTMHTAGAAVESIFSYTGAP